MIKTTMLSHLFIHVSIVKKVFPFLFPLLLKQNVLLEQTIYRYMNAQFAMTITYYVWSVKMKEHIQNNIIMN